MPCLPRHVAAIATWFCATLVTAAVPGQVQTSNSVGMTLRRIPAGCYIRGDTADATALFGKDHPERTLADQTPPHPVRITRPFYIGATEVTVGQFRQFVRATGYETTAESDRTSAVGFKPSAHGRSIRMKQPFHRGAEFHWRNAGFEQSDRHPVVGISWHDAMAFCRWLSEREGVHYRLPTEAEWEYACRAGTRTAFAWGDQYRQRIHRQANVGNVELEKAHEDLAVRQWFLDVDRDPGDRHVYTAPAGSYPANRWGLHDMHGNVWEWCHDTYRDTVYEQFRSPRYPLPNTTAVDPVSEERWNPFGDWRVIRGGSWYTAPVLCRADVRGYFDAPDAACYLGFRVAREAPAEEIAAARADWQRERTAITRLKKVIGDFHVPPGTMLERTARFDTLPPADVSASLHRITFLTGIAAHGIDATFLQHASRIRGLKRLEVHHIPSLRDADVAPLAELASLETLSLAGSSRLSNDCLPHLSGLIHLRRLRLSGRAITDDGLKQLRRLKELNELNLRETSTRGAILSALGEVPLKRLELADLSDEHAARLSGLTELEHFACSGSLLTDGGFEHFAALTRLRSLSVRGCSSLTPAAFASLRPLRRLVSLELRGTQAGDEAVRQLAEHYELSTLGVDGPNLTDEGMRSICDIISLQNLSIGRGARITDAGFKDFWRLQRLDRLAIESDGLTGSGFDTLAEARNLRRLVIRSSNLADEALEHIGTLPRLRELLLQNPGQLTDRGLMMLVDAEKLVYLELQLAGSPIHDRTIERLEQAKPDLTVQVRR